MLPQIFRMPQLSNQAEDLERSRDKEGWGWLWEMGLGKSKQLVDTAAHLWRHGDIAAVLVVAPNGVHANWLGQELPAHQPLDVSMVGHTWYSSRAATKAHGKSYAEATDPTRGNVDKLRYLVMSYDAIRTETGYAAAAAFLKQYRTLLALDESTAIKTPKAMVSRRCQALGKLAAYRRIMDGTPVAESPFDIYEQLKFLDPLFWKRQGYGSYFVFKQQFGLFRQQRAAGGHMFHQLLEYRNLPQLQQLIETMTTRYLKEDVLDLPPKVYSRLVFELAPEQAKAYADLKEEYVAQLDCGLQVEAGEAMVRLMRLQQITSGFVGAQVQEPPQPGDEVMAMVQDEHGHDVTVLGVLQVPNANGMQVVRGLPHGIVAHTGTNECVVAQEYFVAPDELAARVRSLKRPPTQLVELVPPEKNPRLQLLLTKLEECHHKVIVWCRFVRDVDTVVEALGANCRRYDGQVKDRERAEALDSFRNDPSVKVLVANPAAIARGVTLTIAKTVIYYSNSFSLVHRLQSEDRAHRIGQTSSVAYYDLVAHKTVDDHILATLRNKFDVAATVTGDRLREWLQ